MALPGNKDFNEYDNYVTDPNPTTSAQAQDYFRNQAELLKAVIDCDFWQPEKVYQPGDVVKSDSMPNGTEAVMVATKASVTSNVEPQWGNVGGANISDGACFWKLRWQHWSKDVATQAQAEAGTDNSTVMTPLRTAQEIDSKRPIKTFTSLKQLGLDNNATIEQICMTMPNFSVLQIEYNNTTNPNIVAPATGGILKIESNGKGRVALRLETFYSGTYKGAFADWANPQFIGWEKLATNGALSMPATNNNFIQITANITESTTEQTAFTYIAPCDGWLRVEMFRSYNAGSDLFRLTLRPSNYYNGAFFSVTQDVGDYIVGTIPVAKGTQVEARYINARSMDCRFIYAQSEV